MEFINNTIEDHYITEDRDAVRYFLADRSFLAEILTELPAQIQSYFGTSQLSLEVFVDPEAEDNTKLLALVNTTLDPEAALDAMNQFDTQWWLKNRPRTQGNLVIDVVFA